MLPAVRGWPPWIKQARRGRVLDEKPSGNKPFSEITMLLSGQYINRVERWQTCYLLSPLSPGFIKPVYSV